MQVNSDFQDELEELRKLGATRRLIAFVKNLQNLIRKFYKK